MSSYAYAYNPTNNPKAGDLDKFELTVASWFRTDEYNAPNGQVQGNEHRDTKPLQTIDLGETSEYAYPGPDRQEINDVGELEYAGDFKRDIGALTEDSVSRYFLAHTHLQVYTTEAQVRIDNWEADTGVQEFTHKDGP